eukprot:CAMPEP_0174744366 /NCGR_PEP_ID=MMETSP1094-20130205/84114_1 /TAXON_ID=156173 /ORGANISM="Chrysochromulina brevifilum, Strain UTEX LB 985" /LENGTH=74 /DNA_ID=CAMNT_0015948741 /DNA_START=326 /DNA_END=551 /DNA_ORIENTATION=+
MWRAASRDKRQPIGATYSWPRVSRAVTSRGSISGAGSSAETPTLPSAMSAHATPCKPQPMAILDVGGGSAPRRA